MTYQRLILTHSLKFPTQLLTTIAIVVELVIINSLVNFKVLAVIIVAEFTTVAVITIHLLLTSGLQL